MLWAPYQRRLVSTIGYRRQYEYILEDLLVRSPRIAFYIRYLDYHCGRDNESCLETVLNQLAVDNIEVQWIAGDVVDTTFGAPSEK